MKVINFTVVNIPNPNQAVGWKETTQRLAALPKGRALAFTLGNGITTSSASAALQSYAKKLGFRVHTHVDNKSFYAWRA